MVADVRGKDLKEWPGEGKVVAEYALHEVKLPVMRHLARTGFKDVRCFWTVATGRSGTGTLCDLIDLSQNVLAQHEPYPHLAWEGKMTLSNRLPRPVYQRLLFLARGEMLRLAAWRGFAYFEVGPLLWPLLPEVQRVFLNSRYIHLVRNPRDTVVSMVSRGWFDWRRSGLAHWWPEYEEANNPWQSAILYWKHTHECGIAMEEQLGPEKAYRIRFEDMISGYEPTLELLDWMDVRQKTANPAKIQHILDNPRNTSSEKDIEKIEWEPAWDPFLHEYCVEAMEELGYE